MTPSTVEAVNEFHRRYPFADVTEMFVSRKHEEAFAAVGWQVYRHRNEVPEHILTWTGYELVKGIYPYYSEK